MITSTIIDYSHFDSFGICGSIFFQNQRLTLVRKPSTGIVGRPTVDTAGLSEKAPEGGINVSATHCGSEFMSHVDEFIDVVVDIKCTLGPKRRSCGQLPL